MARPAGIRRITIDDTPHAWYTGRRSTLARGTMGPMTAAKTPKSAECTQSFGSPGMPVDEGLAALSSSNTKDATRASLPQAVTRLRPRAYAKVGG